MNEETFVLDLPYSIKYSTEKDVPLKDVIKTLEAIDKLLSNSASTLGQVSGVDIVGQQILINKEEAGNLLDDIVLKLFFHDQMGVSQANDWIKNNVKTKDLLVGALLGASLSHGYETLTQDNASLDLKKNSSKSDVSDADNTVNEENGNSDSSIAAEAAMVAAAQVFNLHPDVVAETVHEQLTLAAAEHLDKHVAAKQTLNFIEPVRDDAEASICFAQGEELAKTVECAALNTVPESYKRPNKKIFEELSNETIHIRANDLDSKKTGWAGFIDGKTERLKIVLDPTLDAEALFGRKSFTADITLEKNDSTGQGEYTPTRIIVRTIY